jgi:acyl-coenzyme A thioesterase PaaI-like protein
VPGYQQDALTEDQISGERELFGPFTQAVRELVDATIRTTVAPEEIRRAQAEIEAITSRLTTSQLPGPFGVLFGTEGRGRPWGNAVVGLRNAVAPPLVVRQLEDTDGRTGRICSDFHLGAAYEGPPDLTHGGVSALILDQLLGEAAGAGNRPGMTATLTLTYRRPTPLGDLRGEAWIERSEDHKTWARGRILAGGEVTVEAEGLFILPRWAREAIAERDAADAPTPRFFE